LFIKLNIIRKYLLFVDMKNPALFDLLFPGHGVRHWPKSAYRRACISNLMSCSTEYAMRLFDIVHGQPSTDDTAVAQVGCHDKKPLIAG